jgi:hypothetical protein
MKIVVRSSWLEVLVSLVLGLQIHRKSPLRKWLDRLEHVPESRAAAAPRTPF